MDTIIRQGLLNQARVIKIWYERFLLLNQYETTPYFLQLSQNLTSYCLLIFVYLPVFAQCGHKIVLQNNFMGTFAYKYQLYLSAKNRTTHSSKTLLCLYYLT